MITAVTVVVPARDEEDEIGGCLDSLAAARAELYRRRGVRTELVVVLDACRDATVDVVGGHPGVEVRTSRAGSVGAARRVGAQHLPPRTGHWLASTDADCRVPVDWLVRMVAHADAGADLVLGTVRPSASGLSLAVRQAWFDAHHLGDGHRNVHAANLGIRASSYALVGGWAALASHEDANLVTRAERIADLRIRRCGDVVVETSSRAHGRAPNGFAGYLGRLGHGVSQPTAG